MKIRVNVHEKSTSTSLGMIEALFIEKHRAVLYTMYASKIYDLTDGETYIRIANSKQISNIHRHSRGDFPDTR